MKTFYDSFSAYLSQIQQPVKFAQLILNDVVFNYSGENYNAFCEKLKTINDEYNFTDKISCTIWHTEKSWSKYYQTDCGVWTWTFYEYPELPFSTND